jgi:hypothetical protein
MAQTENRMYNVARMLNQTVIQMTAAQTTDSHIFELVGIFFIL